MARWNGEFVLANHGIRAVFTWLSKGIGFGFGFGFTTPFGWLVYLLWFWFYDSQVKTALFRLKTASSVIKGTSSWRGVLKLGFELKNIS